MNKELNTELLDRAIIYAVKAHANTERRGKGFPYIVHPMEAVAIVSTITPDQELLAAAALHDVVEDTDVTIEEIRAEFGDRIATLVAADSDTPGGSWHDRKQAAIDRLAKASYDAKVVAMGDKLSNMRAIARDYELVGDHLWDLFHAPNGRPDHEWHYRGLAGSLFELAGTFAYREFVGLIDKVFGEMDMDHPVLVDINDYEESGGGFCATSYNHKDGKTMSKFYDVQVPNALPIQELMLSRRVNRMGIPTPMSGRLITDGTRTGVEYHRIKPKESFARYISNRPESLEDIAVRFALMTKKLHSTECDKNHFESVADHFHEIVTHSEFFTEEEKQRMHKFIDDTPEADTCIHGDLHIGNVITTGGPLSKDVQKPVYDLWIDLGDFRWGNPYFDLGMWYFVCFCNPDSLTTDLYHIGNAQMQQVFDIFAREYAGADTPAKLEAFKAKLRPYAALKMVDLLSQFKNFAASHTFEEGFNPVVSMSAFVRQELLS